VPGGQSNDAEKEAASAIAFVCLGVFLLLIGQITLAVFSFLLAGYAARLWNAKNELRRAQGKPGGEISIQEDSAAQALGALFRTTYDLRLVRKILALLSFGLLIVLVYWSFLNSVKYSVPSKNTGEGTYSVFLVLNACLYWCLGFRIPTHFRRWIAGGALVVTMWLWIAIHQLPSHDFSDPPEIVHISALIFLSMVGAFITLAIISFVDDEEDEPRQSR
jgi:hypothetical protein